MALAIPFVVFVSNCAAVEHALQGNRIAGCNGGRLCSHCLGTPLLKRCSCRYCGRDWLVTAGGLVNEQNMQAGKPGAVGRAGQSVGSHLILFDAVPAHIVVGISYLVLSVRCSQMAQRSSKSRLQRVVWPRIRAVYRSHPDVSTKRVPCSVERGYDVFPLHYPPRHVIIFVVCERYLDTASDQDG